MLTPFIPQYCGTAVCKKEHYFAPLTHSPKGRRRASITMCVVTPSGAGGERERCESFKKMTTYFVF
ncbi:MAG: hypothetical protein FNNCIFGK_01180 [Bacteroidia bacterium]|nr:hypothetical protein [Bacteroidia bacterium]